MADLLAWVNQNAGTVQAASSLLIVFVTGYYAWTTRRIATQTDSMAQATRRLADEAQNQRLDATLPVIAFRNLGWTPTSPTTLLTDRMATASHFALTLANVGSGPALDIRIQVTSPIPYVRRREPGDEMEPFELPTSASSSAACTLASPVTLLNESWPARSTGRSMSLLPSAAMRSSGYSRCTRSTINVQVISPATRRYGLGSIRSGNGNETVILISGTAGTLRRSSAHHATSPPRNEGRRPHALARLLDGRVGQADDHEVGQALAGDVDLDLDQPR